LTTAVFAALFAVMVARRARRTFGRQPLTVRHLVPRLVLLPLVSAAVLLSWPSTEAVLAALVGAGLGLGLGVLGFALTRFESHPEGDFYRPNVWVGALVMALFLGRMAMRASVIYAASANAGLTPGAVPRSPLTTGIIFLVAAQGVGSSGLLLRERSRRRKAGS
jgi:O-antigen/teichoic acid export membrane protein